jgi:hypothetical protein
MTRVVSIPYTFVMLNWAAVVGFVYFVRGKLDIWNAYERSQY